MTNTKKYLIKDYMQTKFCTLKESDTYKDAVKSMINNKTNGAVIVNQQFQIIGILSSWDLIQYLVPDYLESDKHLASFESGDIFAKRINEIKNVPVANFMIKKVHTCNENHSLMEASTLLSEFHIRQLPVVDNNGKLIGYITRTDIKKVIGEILDLD